MNAVTVHGSPFTVHGSQALPHYLSRMTDRRPAVLLLSGGLDSTTMLAYAIANGFDVHAMTFRYGQRHAHEIEAARRVARAYGVADHVVVDIDLRTFGGSALTADIAVPKDRTSHAMATGIPITYVPARNTIFLSFGVNALDYSGYPDCRPEYVAAFERMANLATRGGVEGTTPIRVQAPLLHLSKRQIVDLGRSLGVDYSITLSCYDPTPDGQACGHCDACTLRLKGFAEAGAADPAPYASV